VLCAVDLGPASPRVLLHAAGFAAVLGAALKVVHVAAETDRETRRRVASECLRMAPYQSMFEESDVLVRVGPVAEAIQQEALQQGATLLVIGSGSHTSLVKLLMGSTCDAILRATRVNTLLVPPNQFDIVTVIADIALTCGPVLAAVDLTEDCRHQLEAASWLAGLAAQPLLIMTVASSPTSDHDASQELRNRAHDLSPVRPTSLIVRRGGVAEEISRCAVAEEAGVVVMGLRVTTRGRPGVLAQAVLDTGRAFVLAVPAAARDI
jgi:nucleotide-binding universal stress UspA family protein